MVNLLSGWNSCRHADAPAALPDHGFIPLRDLGRANGKGLFQLTEIRPEGRLEEERCIKGVTLTPVKGNENILPDR